MIHPDSTFKNSWDSAVLLVSVISAVLFPLSMVFSKEGFLGSSVIPFFVYALFIADIVISFKTGHVSRGKFISDKTLITRGYLRGWFALDLIAAVPLGVFLIFLPGSFILRILQLNVIIKLIKSNRTIRRLVGRNINPAILRLFLLVFYILLTAHIISCGWILIGGVPPELEGVAKYVRAFYWTITTVTTIGYGDITPAGTNQTFFVILIELIGAGMYGLVIGNIANLLANIDVAKTQYKEKMDKINAFMKYQNIPHDLQKKINDYYEYLWESRRGYDESSVLADLPDPLKVSVSLHINKEIIEKVPIFQHASEDLIKEIIMNLQPVVFTPGDYVVIAGEVGFDMFFISKGSVDVLSADEKVRYTSLTSGAFFGEIALLLSSPRTATIKAIEYCDCYRLDKDTFDTIIARYPDFEASIKELAEKRKAEIEASK